MSDARAAPVARRMSFAAGSLTRRRWLALAGGLCGLPRFAAAAAATVPVLAYHRFGAEAVDSMTIRLATFRAHIEVLRSLACHVVPMQDFLQWQAGRKELPPRAVVLAADALGRPTRASALFADPESVLPPLVMDRLDADSDSVESSSERD